MDAGSGHSSILWSTGETTQQVSLTEADNPISFTITSNRGCTAVSEEFNVEEKINLEPIISGDTTYCEGDSIFLDAGNSYATYLWTTGETTPTINFSTVGTYEVTVSNANCSHTGSIDIAYEELTNPNIFILGDSAFCVGEVSLLYLDQECVS